MDAYIGEIRLMPYNFAPKGWLQCLGQTLPISQYSALFSILGINYGGNGTTTFMLPNFAGTAAIGAGSGAGLSTYSTGETVGASTETLTVSEMAAHVHKANGSLLTGGVPDSPDPTGRYVAAVATEQYGETAGSGTLAADSVSGGPTSSTNPGGPHNNMMPYLALNFCICLDGEYPSRS